MTRAATTRKSSRLSLLLWAGLAAFTLSVAARTQPPAPAERHVTQPAAPVLRKPASPAAKNLSAGKLQGEHLPAWLDRHSTETTAQKLQSLEKEPGFHDLPPQTQQRIRDRLVQIEAMPPERRQQLIARTEAMEKLTPDQYTQVKSVLGQLANLPPASRRAVQRTFRVVRSMPVDQRQAYLTSPDIRSQFTDQERDVLQRLMTVEPFLPPGTAVSQQP